MPRIKAKPKNTKPTSEEGDTELKRALEISFAMQREEEERRAKLEAEVKRKIAEEERIRREQLARAQEDQLKREQERAQHEVQEKAKQEQEKRKRLEEQVQKKLEAEKKKEADRLREAEEKRLQMEEAERKLYEEQEQKKHIAKSGEAGITEFVPSKTEADTIDLLGGLTDDEEEEIVPRNEPQVSKRQQPWERQEIKESRLPQGNAASGHRDQPQRGNVDVLADDFFDHTAISVSVKKTSKTDGVYLFGSRVMKLQLQNGQLVVAISPKNKMSLGDFIAKFEKVESLRAKGLQSALHMCTMMGAKQTPAQPALVKA